MVKLVISSGTKKILYKPFSISLRYLINEKKIDVSLDNLVKVFNVRLTVMQRKTFLSKNGSDIKLQKHDGKPDEIIISKVKIDESFSPDYFRNYLAGFLPSLENEAVKNLHIFIPKYDSFKDYFNSEEYYYQSFVEGVFLGNYSFVKYKSEKNELKILNVNFYAENSKKLNSAISKTKLVLAGLNFARDLQNEPAEKLSPSEFAKRISVELKKVGVSVKVFNEIEIRQRNMGGLLAVGKGSMNPPRFIVIEYSGISKSKKIKKKIVFVGKGITFDSGGISIKPAADMWEMKADMSGGAVVAGTILAAAKAKLSVNLIGIIPAAENMVSGNSMRPGDIVITSSGKSIEVDNTDAEGRMILADGLTYASKLKPDVIIDLATLTGACVVALGEFVAGLFTKDDKLAKDLYRIGLETHERLWRLPMWDDYNVLNKSEVADVKNLGGRWGGAITAAKFLENFVDKKIPWAHIDIAGPALANNYNNYTKKFMTGFGVRLLFEYLNKI
ncbi:MAG: leucyl aminopeptidase [Ignavibacteriaceae bacterium]